MTTRIADVIVPEVFNPYVVQRTMELSALVQSGIILNSVEFNRLASQAAKTVIMPFWSDLTGEDEVLTDQSALTPGKITAGQDEAVILRRGRAWGANDLAANLAGDDPMRAIGDLVAAYWARRLQANLLSTLAGVFGSASMAGNLHDISSETGDKAVISADTFVDAVQKLGDAKEALSGILMHSATEAKLAKDNLIQTVRPADGSPEVRTYMGKRVIVDDGCPVNAGVYTTYIFGPGAIARAGPSLVRGNTGGMSKTQAQEVYRVAIFNSIVEVIGQTPMVRLNRLPDADSAEVVVKVESLNPGGSIKARPARRMIEEAEASGELKPGGTIVEASSGNQGISLAMIGAVKGYRVVVFMPESMSVERRKVLEAYGAEVRLTPLGKDIKETLEICVEASKEFAASTPGAYRARQFENPENCCAHEYCTAREIFEQTGGRLDAFVASIGTGGTVTGIGRLLKTALENVLVVAAEPDKASLFMDIPFGFHVQEGIGDGILPEILDKSVVDRAILVSDFEAVSTARRLAREEGIFCGISSGTNVFAALRIAKELGPGKRVVTIIPDGGEKYLSTALFERR